MGRIREPVLTNNFSQKALVLIDRRDDPKIKTKKCGNLIPELAIPKWFLSSNVRERVSAGRDEKLSSVDAWR